MALYTLDTVIPFLADIFNHIFQKVQTKFNNKVEYLFYLSDTKINGREYNTRYI